MGSKEYVWIFSLQVYLCWWGKSINFSFLINTPMHLGYGAMQLSWVCLNSSQKDVNDAFCRTFLLSLFLHLLLSDFLVSLGKGLFAEIYSCCMPSLIQMKSRSYGSNCAVLTCCGQSYRNLNNCCDCWRHLHCSNCRSVTQGFLSSAAAAWRLVLGECISVFKQWLVISLAGFGVSWAVNVHR